MSPYQPNSRFFKPGSVYTDTGLLELEVQFVGIGKFAAAKKNEGTPRSCKKK